MYGMVSLHIRDHVDLGALTLESKLKKLDFPTLGTLLRARCVRDQTMSTTGWCAVHRTNPTIPTYTRNNNGQVDV
jgi:hypothetical protein